MKKYNNILVSSEPLPKPIESSSESDNGDSVLPHLGRRVVDMSAVNSQTSHKAAVCYPPAKLNTRKDNKKKEKKHKKQEVHTTGEHRKVVRESSKSLQQKKVISRDARPSSDDQRRVSREMRSSSDDQRRVSREMRSSSDENERVNVLSSSMQLPAVEQLLFQAFDDVTPADSVHEMSVHEGASKDVESQVAVSKASREGRKNKFKSTEKKANKIGSNPHKKMAVRSVSAEKQAVSEKRELPASDVEPNFAPAAPSCRMPFQTRTPSELNEKIKLRARTEVHPRRTHVNSGSFNSISRSGTFRKTRPVVHALKRGERHTMSESIHKMVDRISAAFLLQSWQAHDWIKSVCNVCVDYLSYMERAIPNVQAKLYSDFNEEDGVVRASIAGYKVMLKLSPYTENQWRNVVTELSNQATFSTDLLNDRLTEQIVDVFRQKDMELFPQGRDSDRKKKKEDLITFCETCQKARCEHVGALILLIAQHIEESPMFLLRLRGCAPEKFNKMMRFERSEQLIDPSDKTSANYKLPVKSLSLSNFYTTSADLSQFKFNVTSAPQSTLLERLGDPCVWQAPVSLSACLMPLIGFAAQDADDLYHSMPLEAHTDVAELPTQVQTADLVHRDIGFLKQEIPQDVINSMSRNLFEAAGELLTRLSKPTDRRTLARQTRLQQEHVRLILQSFMAHHLVTSEGEGDKAKYSVSFENTT